MLVAVTEENLAAAGYIHSVSWVASHRSFYSAEFVERHTPEAQTAYLRRELAAGKKLFMLLCPDPVGIVSVDADLIENLYVLPSRQRQGHGTQLLAFAISQCSGLPHLWTLSNNGVAYHLYARNGFVETGNRKELRPELSQIELYCPDPAQVISEPAMRCIRSHGVPEGNNGSEVYDP